MAILVAISALRQCSDAGMTQAEAARALGLPAWLISRRAREWGIEFRPHMRNGWVSGKRRRS